MRANPAIILDLVGYSNDVSNLEDNEKLAMARAQAVQEYLIETGVARERLIAKPGAVSPGPDKPAVERAKGRRVEFVPTNSESIPTEYQDKDLTTEGPQG
jgi:outer membrane protein OmpA-like peptidoglycan-associated protein